MQTREKSSIACIKYVSNIIPQMKENVVYSVLFIWFLTKIGFLDTRSYFLPAN